MNDPSSGAPPSPLPASRRRRRLRLLIAAAAFSCVATIALYLGLKWLIVRAVNQQLVGHATWSTFDISPGAIRVTGLEVFDRVGGRVLSAPEVRVSYSVRALVSGGALAAALQDVVVEQPHVDLRLRPDGTVNLADVLRLPPGPSVPPERMFHGNVLVHGGEVYFKDERTPFVAVFEKVDGVIDMQTLEHAQGRLTFTQPGPPLARYRLNAAWRRNFVDLRASFDVDDLDVAGWTNYYLKRTWDKLPALARGELRGGRGRARLLVSTAGPPGDWRSSLHLSGSVWVEDLAGQLERFPVPITKGRLTAVLMQDLLDVKRFTAEVGGDYVEAAGRLYNRRNPQIDMAVLARSRSIAGTLRRFGVKTPVPLEGQGQVSLQFEGAIKGPPFIHVSLASPKLRVAGRTLRGVDGRFDWSSGTWRVERLAAQSEGGTMEASGWVFTDEHHRLVLDVRTKDARLRELVGAMFGADARASADLTVIGSQRNPLVVGQGSVRNAQVQGFGVSRASGSFVYNQRALLFSDVDAATSYGLFRSPFGYLDLTGSRTLLAEVSGSGLTMQSGGARVDGGSMSMVVAGHPGAVFAAGRVRAGDISSSGLNLHDVDAIVAISPDLLWLNHGTFTVGGSRLSVSGAVSPRDRTFDLRAWSPSLDPAAVLASLNGPRLPLAPGVGPFSLEAIGTTSSAAFRAGFAGGVGRFDVTGVRDAAGIRGVAFGEGLDASLLEAVGLHKWHPRGGVDAMTLFAVAGGRFDIDLVGLSRGLRVGGIPFDRVMFSASSGGGAMDVRAGALSGPVATVTLFGRIPTAGDGAWGLAWNADLTDLNRAVRSLDVGPDPMKLRRLFAQMRINDLSGHAFASGSMGGTRQAPRVDGEFLVDRATLHGDPVMAQGDFRAEHDRLTLHHTQITMDGDPVAVEGSVGLTASPRFDLVVTTPHFDLPRALGFTPYRGMDVAGWLEGKVRLTGPVSRLAADGRLRLRGGRLREQRLDDVEVTLRAGHDSIIVQQLMARLGTGTLTGHGTLRINGPLDLDLTARNFPLREVAALQSSPLARGRGDVRVRITGTTSNPRVSADFEMGALELAGSKAPVSLAGRMQWVSPRLELENVSVSRGNDLGTASVSGYVDFARRVLPATFDEFLAGQGRLDVTLAHARLSALSELVRPDSPHKVAGELNGTLEVTGRLRTPTVSGTMSGAGLRLDGIDVGTLQATGTYDAATGEIGNFDLATQGGAGSLHASRTGTSKENQVTVQANEFEVGALAALVPWQFPFAGRLNASFDMSGPLFEPTVNGSFQVTDGRLAALAFDTFSGSVVGADGVYHLQNFVMVKGPHRAMLSGVLPLRWQGGVFVSPAPIDIKGVVSEDNLDMLSLFIPDMLPSPGQLRATVNVSGMYPDVELNGELTVRNGSIHNKLLAQPLDNVDVSVGLKGRRLEIQRATGTLGKGLLTVAGGADVKGFSLSDMNIRISGKELSVMAPPYLSSLLDADLHLTGSTADPFLGGTISARSARITLPMKGLAGLSGGSGAKPAESAPTGPSRMSQAARNAEGEPAGTDATAVAAPAAAGARAPFPLPPLTFSVDVSLGNDAWLRFLGSAVKAEGQVALVGKGENAVPAGEITLKSGQIQIPFFPTSMRLTNGKAYFEPSSGWTPYLVANAVAKVGQYEIYVDVSGTASSPDVKLSSNPPLPQMAIRQLLLGGVAAQPNIFGPAGYTQNTSLGLGALVNVAETTFLRPVTNFIGGLFGVSEINLELVAQGALQLTVYKALDARQKFLLLFSSLQGNNQQVLPRQLYGLEYRFTPAQLVRISADNLGGVHFFYQARWTF